MALVLSMGFALVARSDVRAQDTELLSTATVAPANAAIYAEIKLDPENAELQQLDELFLRLGSDESLIAAIQESAEEATSGVDITDAELALVVMPSALESAAESGAPEIGDLTDSGSVASEISQAGVGAGNEGIGIIIRPADITDFESLAAEEAGPDAEAQDYLGYEIVSYIDDDGDSSAYVVVGNFIVYATTVEDVMRFVDAALDGDESLAGVDEVGEVSAALPGERLAFAYMNGELIVEAAATAAEADDPALTPVMDEVLASYRAHIGATLGAEENGVSLETVMIPADGSTVESSGTADGLLFAEQVPADTVVLSSGYDLGETIAMRSLGLILVAGLGAVGSDSSDETEATPVPMTIDEMYGSLAQFLGFNIKTNFIDQLTGPYAFAVWGIDSQDPAEIGAVLVSGVEDPTVVSDAVSSISFLVQAAAQGEVSIVSRSVADATVNSVSFDAEGSELTVDFGVVGDQFLLGLGDGVDTLLLGPDGTLADSPRYMAALEYLPAEFQAVQYVDVAAIVAASEADTGGMIGDVVATPIAGEMGNVQPESYTAVTYVENGYTRMSAILVFA